MQLRLLFPAPRRQQSGSVVRRCALHHLVLECEGDGLDEELVCPLGHNGDSWEVYFVTHGEVDSTVRADDVEFSHWSEQRWRRIEWELSLVERGE